MCINFVFDLQNMNVFPFLSVAIDFCMRKWVRSARYKICIDILHLEENPFLMQSTP